MKISESELEDNIISNVLSEWEIYKQETLKQSKEYIFDNSFETDAKHEITGCLMHNISTNAFTLKQKEALNTQGNYLLEALYQAYLNDDFASICNYDEIILFVSEFADLINI